jgi:multicomponent Na+:H+ antiporter subunit F
MMPWLIAGCALLFGLVPLGFVVFRGDPMDRLVGLEAASAIFTMVMMLLAIGFERMPLFDLALAAGLLSFGGGLVFARFLEHWL